MSKFEKCEHKLFYRNNIELSKLQASCKSELLECNYYIKATVEFDTYWCCVDKICLEIPIIIYYPNLLNENVDNYRPQDWSPKIMPPLLLSLPNAEETEVKQEQVQLQTEINEEKVITIEELLKRNDIKIIDTPETQAIVSDLGLSKDILTNAKIDKMN